MNSMPKYVVSSTIAEPLEWNNSTVVKGAVAKEVTRLKEQDGGPLLVFGSATLVRALIEYDLVDELRLMVFPVMVGGGLRAFPESRAKNLFELTDVTRFSTGVAVHTYRPASASLADDGAQALRDVGVDVDSSSGTRRWTMKYMILIYGSQQDYDAMAGQAVDGPALVPGGRSRR